MRPILRLPTKDDISHTDGGSGFIGDGGSNGIGDGGTVLISGTQQV